MIMFFDIFGKMVWKDACLFYAEVGKSYIQTCFLCIHNTNIIFE